MVNITVDKKESFFKRTKRKFFGENTFKLSSSTLEEKAKRRTLLLPIKLTITYLVATLILYVIGPFEWITYKPFLFYGLMIFYIVALWLGYRIGLMREFQNQVVWSEKHSFSLLKIIQPLLLLNLLVMFVNIFRAYSMVNFNFIDLISQMVDGVMNPGIGYENYYQRLLSSVNSVPLGGKLFSVFNYFWAFFEYSILLLGTYYFSKLSLGYKISLIANLTTTVFFYLSIGTNIGLFRVMLMIIIPFMVKLFSEMYHKKKIKIALIKLLLIVLACIVFMASYFTITMSSRGAVHGGGINLIDKYEQYKDEYPNSELPTDQNSYTYSVGGIKVNYDSFLYKLVPRPIKKLLVSGSAYLTQGYYSMSLALKMPWTPMFGLGSSMIVVDNVSEYIYDINQFTYQTKLEDFGWDSRIRWHSMYTWLANDVSFYGVILVMFVIGYFFGAMYKDAITTKNPFSKISLFFFILLLIFIPCNNQLAQNIGTMFSFILIVFCWVCSKHNYKWLKRIVSPIKKIYPKSRTE